MMQVAEKCAAGGILRSSVPLSSADPHYTTSIHAHRKGLSVGRTVTAFLSAKLCNSLSDNLIKTWRAGFPARDDAT